MKHKVLVLVSVMQDRYFVFSYKKNGKSDRIIKRVKQINSMNSNEIPFSMKRRRKICQIGWL